MTFLLDTGNIYQKFNNMKKLSLEYIKDFYLNNGFFHYDYPDYESWTDADWFEYAEAQELE